MMRTADQQQRASNTLHDCWNIIGIHGDASCDKLREHAHCRNCTTYAMASANLLERDLPPGYLEERTRYFAQDKPAEKTGARQSVAIFRIGPEWLALPASVLAEVANMRSVHRLPHRHGGTVLGLTNIRGTLLVCVSLGWLLGLEAPDPTNHDSREASAARLLVIHGERGRLVFAADEMHGIHRFDSSALQPVPATVSQAAHSYVQALLPWQDHIVGCLDAPLVLHALERGLA
jgi:chemotaxis-related protein WspD